MSTIRVACQTYTWEMRGRSWTGSVTDMLDAIAEAGYEGVEISNNMIGEFRDRPADLAEELSRRDLALAAIAYSTGGFTDPACWEDDVAGAKHVIAYLKSFPEPRLALGGAAFDGPDRSRERLSHAIRFYNEVGALGEAAGIGVNVHPHSHHGSLLESTEDYQFLIDHLDPVVTFGPDSGHIVRGGQDLLECLRTHVGRITHLHLKDASPQREWKPMGEGVCDFAGVLKLLRANDYHGWIVGEEESQFAYEHPDEAIRHNREYLRELGV